MKTKEMVSAYKILNEAKLTKMDDADKFKVIKALRAMKVIAKDFEDFMDDAKEKLKGENHEEMLSKAQEWNSKHGNSKLGDLSAEEAKELADMEKYFSDYSKKVDGCIAEESEKEAEAEFCKLSEDAFAKLVASNDWTCGQMMQISDAVAE